MRAVKSCVCLGFLYLVLSCQTRLEEKTLFPDHDKLITFLRENGGTGVLSESSVIVFFLHNRSCLCSEKNLDFVGEICSREELTHLNKVLVLPEENHEIIPRIDTSKVSLIIEENLMAHGLIFVFDKVFVLDSKSNIQYWTDIKSDNYLSISSAIEKFLM